MSDFLLCTHEAGGINKVHHRCWADIDALSNELSEFWAQNENLSFQKSKLKWELLKNVEAFKKPLEPFEALNKHSKALKTSKSFRKITETFKSFSTFLKLSKHCRNIQTFDDLTYVLSHIFSVIFSQFYAMENKHFCCLFVFKKRKNKFMT